jgi:hypothetical protein
MVKKVVAGAERKQSEERKADTEVVDSEGSVHAHQTQSARPQKAEVVLTTGPNSRSGSGYRSTQNRAVRTGLTTRKTLTIGHRPVFSPNSCHFKFTILAPIKYFSSDCIMT